MSPRIALLVSLIGHRADGAVLGTAPDRRRDHRRLAALLGLLDGRRRVRAAHAHAIAEGEGARARRPAVLVVLAVEGGVLGGLEGALAHDHRAVLPHALVHRLRLRRLICAKPVLDAAAPLASVHVAVRVREGALAVPLAVRPRANVDAVVGVCHRALPVPLALLPPAHVDRVALRLQGALALARAARAVLANIDVAASQERDAEAGAIADLRVEGLVHLLHARAAALVQADAHDRLDDEQRVCRVDVLQHRPRELRHVLLGRDILGFGFVALLVLAGQLVLLHTLPHAKLDWLDAEVGGVGEELLGLVVLVAEDGRLQVHGCAIGVRRDRGGSTLCGYRGELLRGGDFVRDQARCFCGSQRPRAPPCRVFNTTRARARAHTPDPQAQEPLSQWTEVWPTQPVRTQAVNRQNVGEEETRAECSTQRDANFKCHNHMDGCVADTDCSTQTVSAEGGGWL